MRKVSLFLIGVFSLTMAAGCCCWDWGCNSRYGNSPCGPGGCGVQQYGQPIPGGASYSPIPTQQAYAPLSPIPQTIALPAEPLPTYY